MGWGDSGFTASGCRDLGEFEYFRIVGGELKRAGIFPDSWLVGGGISEFMAGGWKD